MSTTDNVHEKLARREKVDALVRYIWDKMKADDRLNPATLDLMTGSNQAARDLVAKHAGQHSPSETTWAMVVDGIARLIEVARWGADHRRDASE